MGVLSPGPAVAAGQDLQESNSAYPATYPAAGPDGFGEASRRVRGRGYAGGYARMQGLAPRRAPRGAASLSTYPRLTGTWSVATSDAGAGGTMRTCELYRADGPIETAVPLPAHLLGEFASVDAAMAERDRDVLSQLERAGGRRIELAHLIVTAHPGGTRSVSRLVCSVGVPIGWPVDPIAEFAETGQWLARLHRLPPP